MKRVVIILSLLLISTLFLSLGCQEKQVDPEERRNQLREEYPEELENMTRLIQSGLNLEQEFFDIWKTTDLTSENIDRITSIVTWQHLTRCLELIEKADERSKDEALPEEIQYIYLEIEYWFHAMLDFMLGSLDYLDGEISGTRLDDIVEEYTRIRCRIEIEHIRGYLQEQ